jgi:hypothetical protein
MSSFLLVNIYPRYIKKYTEPFVNIVGLKICENIKKTNKYKNFIYNLNINLYKIKNSIKSINAFNYKYLFFISVIKFIF